MARPLISVLHPTRRVAPSEAFPRGWRDAFDAWLAHADHPENIEYVLAIHESRWDAFCDGDLISGCEMNTRSRVRYAMNRGRDCVVDQTNRAFEESTGLLITGAADDYYPPEHWDTLLLGAIALRGLPRPELDVHLGIMPIPEELEHECVIVCATGAAPERDRELMIGASVTRKVFERRGYVLDPDFESMFADNWYAFENRRDAAAGLLTIIERLDIQFDHRHPIFGKGQMDEAYAQQNRPEAYRQGQATFMRKAFGTHVLYACCPGETFRAEWVWPTFDLLMQLNIGNRFMVAPIGGHTSNVYCTRMEMAESVLGSVPAADYVLWVDDDNVLSFAQFNLLYQDLVEHPELSGVTGWCWCDNDGKPDQDGKLKPWMMSVGRQGADLECYRMTQEDLQNAQKNGTMLITSDDLEPHAFWSGFPVVLMRASALRELGASAFAPIVDPKVKFGFTSEDTSFFVNARKAGQKWAVDLRVKVPHGKFRAIEPFGILTAANQDEYLEAKGLKTVPLSSAAD